MLRRYSSHRQKDVSIEQQVAACQAHAADLGIALVESYEDRAISGKTDNRPAFRRMMRDAEAGLFAYVIAWKSNRIGRNMMEAMVNEARLSELGVKVLCVEEDFDDSAAGRFALRSMMNVNQFYIENMAEDIRRGMRDNAKNCKVNGPLPYGYRKGADGGVEEAVGDRVQRHHQEAGQAGAEHLAHGAPLPFQPLWMSGVHPTLPAVAEAEDEVDQGEGVGVCACSTFSLNCLYSRGICHLFAEQPFNGILKATMRSSLFSLNKKRIRRVSPSTNSNFSSKFTIFKHILSLVSFFVNAPPEKSRYELGKNTELCL